MFRGKWHRIDPVEASPAKLISRNAGGLREFSYRDISQAVCADRFANLGDCHLVSNELGPSSEVNAEEAGPFHWWAGNAHVNFTSTILPQHFDQGGLSVAPHDGVVDNDQPLTLDNSSKWVQLQADAELSDGL